jgi:hypothetical protein
MVVRPLTVFDPASSSDPTLSHIKKQSSGARSAGFSGTLAMVARATIHWCRPTSILEEKPMRHTCPDCDHEFDDGFFLGGWGLEDLTEHFQISEEDARLFFAKYEDDLAEQCARAGFNFIEDIMHELGIQERDE